MGNEYDSFIIIGGRLFYECGGSSFRYLCCSVDISDFGSLSAMIQESDGQNSGESEMITERDDKKSSRMMSVRRTRHIGAESRQVGGVSHDEGDIADFSALSDMIQESDCQNNEVLEKDKNVD